MFEVEACATLGIVGRACILRGPLLVRVEVSMKTPATKVRHFLTSEDGPTAVEYAVMLALIVIVCLTAIRAVGTNANTLFQRIAAELG